MDLLVPKQTGIFEIAVRPVESYHHPLQPWNTGALHQEHDMGL